MKRKGFTLIELLIVIAVLAVLMTVVILVLNPTELLKQSRDSNRISDLATIKSALGFYIVDVPAPNLASSSVAYGGCYLSALPPNATSAASCGYFNGIYTFTTISSTPAVYRNLDGTGWLPVNFRAISSGAPFTNLPVDPINDKNFFYAYAATSSLVFELETAMESRKFGLGGSSDVESKDGGNSSTTYEIGSTYVF